MKKALSILMSILIIALSFTFIASAVDACPECGSKEHKAEKCGCCLYCPNLDTALVVPCIRDGAGIKKDHNGEIAFCCRECDGWYPCDCSCDCCVKGASDFENSNNNQILNENQQQQVISGFQAVMARLREFFDKLFDTIFEFLRFDEIMGNN